MAKLKGAKVEKAPAKKVLIQDLVNEFGLEGRRIRQVIRGLGIKAPKLDGVTGFGPHSKYEWDEGSKELNQIREALQAAKDKPPTERAPRAKAEKASKSKSSKKAAEVDEEEEEEDDEEEDDEEEDEEDE
ncbi:MAG: hypothetical protein KGL39_16445 [Patescibacteria group bacterium]|nr:hypothetical protein [Patescibacteria group bacterium]